MVADSSAARICPEDVVCLTSDPSTPGMVCCVGEDLDTSSSSPTAHVYWLREHDNDRMEHISELSIIDRSLLHGDTVIHKKRKGIVTSTRMLVDMRYSDGTTVRNVDTKSLKHLQPFRQGSWVVSDCWLGRVVSYRDDVVVNFDDGSQCLVTTTTNGELVAAQKMYERSPLFPSMLVKAGQYYSFKEAQWIKGSYNKQKQGIVATTHPVQVSVAWIAALKGSSSIPPAADCSPDSLTLLNHFGHTWWRLGDRTIFPREGDPNLEATHNCCEIVGSRTSVDVRFMDGSLVTNLPAVETVMFNPGPHEFYPGDLVCEKEGGDRGNNTISVIVSADERTRMAMVQRLPQKGSPGDSGELTTLSVFDLVVHPDFSFRMGDVVLKLESAIGGDESAPIQGEGYGVVPPREEEELGDTPSPRSNETASQSGESSDGPYDEYDDDDLGTDGAVDGGDVADDPIFDMPSLMPNFAGGFDTSMVWRDGKGHGVVGEVIEVMGNGRVLVAWLGDVPTAVHPEEIYRLAIEDEGEDAMFYPEDSAYPSAVAQPDEDGANLSLASSFGNVTSLLRTYEYPLFRVVAPILMDVGSAVYRMPIIGSIVGGVGGLMAWLVKKMIGNLRGFMPLARLPSTVSDSQLASSLPSNQSEHQTYPPASGGAGVEAAAQDSNFPTTLASDVGSQPIVDGDSGAVVDDADHGPGFGLGTATQAADSDTGAAEANGQGREAERVQAQGAEGVSGGSGSVEGEEVERGGGEGEGEGEGAGGGQGEGGKGAKVFENVTIVEDDDSKPWEHHHYAARIEQPRNPGKFMGKVQKEWALLRSHLPHDIFVTVFEDRADLLQCVIKGPRGTPYANGLFFFDIQLPAEYPEVPPRVFYHAHGDRLNPNLYENGKVCLSLLGTWAGTSVESWDSKKSNILQVLVSIQGLILVPEPYYNEPSYEQYRHTEDGRLSSKQYNESAFLLTLRSILTSCRNPPKHFAQLAASHYGEVREEVLDSCREKLAQAKQEWEASQEGEDDAGAASLGFSLSLERLIPKLEQELGKAKAESPA